MAARLREINLLPQEGWGRKPVGRILKWALTIGRYIVITTELIVIIAFVSRFKLDRDLSNLYEKIEIKQARVKSATEFEKQFRSLQQRLKAIRDLSEKQTDFSQTLTRLASLTPLNVTLQDLRFGQTRMTITGQALSESGLAIFINNLQVSPYFDEVEIENISQDQEIEISFNLETSFNLEDQ